MYKEIFISEILERYSSKSEECTLMHQYARKN